MAKVVARRGKRDVDLGTIKGTQSKFSGEVFEAIADDLKTGRIPLPRVTISDNLQSGLRVIIRNTGLISYHVHYDVDGSRPFMKIGDYPAMTIPEARRVAETVRQLAGLGIDVQAGLHERLIKELKEKGAKWRP